MVCSQSIFFRNRIDAMFNMNDPLAVLAKRVGSSGDSGGARHRTLEVESPQGLLLAARRAERYAVLHQLCRQQQPVLAAACHCPSGHRGSFLVSFADWAICTACHMNAIRHTWATRLRDWFDCTEIVKKLTLSAAVYDI